MPVNLSIKKVPDDIVARLKERALRHHRSVRGELLAIIDHRCFSLINPVQDIADRVARSRHLVIRFLRPAEPDLAAGKRLTPQSRTAPAAGS
jgi:plasmid stability protein